MVMLSALQQTLRKSDEKKKAELKGWAAAQQDVAGDGDRVCHLIQYLASGRVLQPRLPAIITWQRALTPSPAVQRQSPEWRG